MITDPSFIPVQEVLGGKCHHTLQDKKLHALNRTFLDALGAAAQAQHYAGEALERTRIEFEALKKADALVRKRDRAVDKAHKALTDYLEKEGVA